MISSQSIPDNAVLEKESQTTNADPRHQKRISLMQALFSYSFGQKPPLLLQDHQRLIKKIIKNLETLDQLIQKHAPERPLQEINRVDLAILRLSVYEAKYTKIPRVVIINEAVELSKEFGTDSSPRFVNGVLGKLLTKNK